MNVELKEFSFLIIGWFLALLTQKVSRDRIAITSTVFLIFDLQEMLEKLQKQLLFSPRADNSDKNILSEIKEIIRKLYVEKSNLLIKCKTLNTYVDGTIKYLHKKPGSFAEVRAILIDILENFSDNEEIVLGKIQFHNLSKIVGILNCNCFFCWFYRLFYRFKAL